jgi:hypothetical protein
MKITMTHPVTREDNEMDLNITSEQMNEWQNGALIQHALPHLTSDEREFLMTGLLPGEFERMYGAETEASP